jgi:CIC family chloride channel protein
LGRGSISPRYALLQACFIGVFSALAALLLKEGVGWLGAYRLKLVDAWGASVALPLLGLCLGAMAGWLVEQLSPTAGGGGIPQVKAALARFPVPLSLRVAIIKIIGTILVLGAGLALGRRGPTVHIGAALAAELSRWVPTSPEQRRQMIAAGAAAGLAAGFNTPIAGVLFVVEELMRDISGLTLETAIVASFTGAVVSLVLQSAAANLPQTLLQLKDISFTTPEIPFYLILGAIAGVLGAAFNFSIISTIRFNRRFQWPLSLRIGIAGLISGLVVSQLPSLFHNYAGLRELLVTGELNGQGMALAFIANFFLTVAAAGSGAPGGLFAPALVMGSALGYLMGDVEAIITGTGSESTYALAGMGAFFTAVVRAPVTAIVIVFELNADFNLVLPLMITCVVAYLSAETCYRGSLYQHLLKGMGMELDEEAGSSQPNFLNQLKAADVMQSKVETVSPHLPVKELLQIMSISHHRGFPVVEKGKLVGIVTQSDLEKATAERDKVSISDIMTKPPIAVNADVKLADVMYLLNSYQLSRLPVIEDNKLVGIITRTDIIRAEVERLMGDTQVKPHLSYICYQTRSPSTGKGRILIPIGKDDDYQALFAIAGAIARYYEYELEFVQVFKVSKHKDPRLTSVKAQDARHLMQRLERMARRVSLPIHTQIRIAHNRTTAILEVIEERHINLLLMVWQPHHQRPEVIFSNLIDSLINQAPCELIFLKLGQNHHYYPDHLPPEGSCLVPMAGGPNAQEGLKLLPALLGVYESHNLPPVYLAKVLPPTETEIDYSELDLASEQLQPLLKTTINTLCIRSHSITHALTHLARAEKCELVILGASRESLLKQALQGNIPEAIASQLDTTVIIVRLP